MVKRIPFFFVYWRSFHIELVYFLIGLIASTFGAIAGLGGGVIIKPVLDFAGHYDVVTIGILSAATVFSMSVVSLFKAVKTGIKIQGRTSLILAIGSIIGGIIGKLIFNYVVHIMSDLNNVTVIQASLLTVLMLFIFLILKNKSSMKTYQLINIFFIIAVGLILGMIATFLGIGGGPLNVAILAIFFSMNVKESAINSIFIIFFSQLASLLITANSTGFGEFDLTMLPFMIGGGILGGLLGSVLLRNFNDNRVENIFNFGLFVIVLINFFNIFRYLI